MKYFDYYALKLVVVCVVVFIFQLSFPVITEEFALVSKDVISRPWILITSIFLHSPYEFSQNTMQYQISFSHLVSNMIALAIFGSILERIIGSKRFLIIFFATGILASIGSVFFYEAALGASGAVMGVAGCLAAIRPKMVLWTPFGFMPMVAAVIFWAIFDLAGVFNPSGIANAAHLAGMFSGIAFGIYVRKYFKIKKSQKLLTEEELDHWEEQYMQR